MILPTLLQAGRCYQDILPAQDYAATTQTCPQISPRVGHRIQNFLLPTKVRSSPLCPPMRSRARSPWSRDCSLRTTLTLSPVDHGTRYWSFRLPPPATLKPLLESQGTSQEGRGNQCGGCHVAGNRASIQRTSRIPQSGSRLYSIKTQGPGTVFPFPC